MYDEFTRSMNAQERATLDELAAGTDPPVTAAGTIKWVFVWSGGIIVCAVAVTGLILADPNPIIFGIIAGPIGLAAIICLCAIMMLISGHFRWSRYHRDFVRCDIPEIQAALKHGDVFVKKVSATAVIEIVEFEDEGPGYIYDVGDGKILFLKGQRFYPVSEEMLWPNSEFEIVRAVHGEMWIGIFCSGQELAPVRELQTSECIDEIVWAEREELLDGNIEEFALSITTDNESRV